jgi:hypothetical protein
MTRIGLSGAISIVALCVWLTACGGVSHRVTSGASVTTTAVTVPPSPSVTGDYDGDDEKGKRSHSEGDNDDSTTPKDGDNDSDNSTHSYFDSDDASVRSFGRAASEADGKTIATLVRRYFRAADAADGAKACAMIVPTFAKSVPETLGRPPGPPFARGATCGAVMSKVFAHYRRQLAAHAPALRVSSVRVRGNEGVAVLAFKHLPGRQLHVARAGGVWMIDGLLDIELP